jgi:hypothetical protein
MYDCEDLAIDAYIAHLLRCAPNVHTVCFDSGAPANIIVFFDNDCDEETNMACANAFLGGNFHYVVAVYNNDEEPIDVIDDLRDPDDNSLRVVYSRNTQIILSEIPYMFERYFDAYPTQEQHVQEPIAWYGITGGETHADPIQITCVVAGVANGKEHNTLLECRVRSIIEHVMWMMHIHYHDLIGVDPGISVIWTVSDGIPSRDDTDGLLCTRPDEMPCQCSRDDDTQKVDKLNDEISDLVDAIARFGVKKGLNVLLEEKAQARDDLVKQMQARVVIPLRESDPN